MRGTEAQSRIKINRLPEDAGWRFFNDENGRANIQLEQGVTITTQEIDALGEDFENNHQGYIDFLLLNENSRPLVVLEAKREEKNPLDGKEQAREYAKSIIELLINREIII
jgi:type I restriction enzyme R subunit